MCTVRFADFFCGIGGIRLGMQDAGFECVFSCDINTECQRTYGLNFGESPHGDIRDVCGGDVPDFDILCAGFPCQPFSISGRKRGFADDRGTLFFDICRLIEQKQPRIVFLENVKHLIHHDKGNTLETILNRLRGLGYIANWQLLNAADYGMPQNRERIIIIASKENVFDFGRIKKRPRRTLVDFLDESGDFEYLEEKDYTLIDNPSPQKKSGLFFVGYRNKSIRKVGVRPGTEHLSRVHKQPNRIYSAMGIHPTLPSQESAGRFWILTSDNRVRKLTIDECFRIMGFPDGFIRPSAVGEQYRQIGNSVCVPMIAAVADAVKRHYFEEGADAYDSFGSIAANL